MFQKLFVHGFEWVEEDDLSRLNENFIKNYDENSDKGYFLDAYVKYSKKIFNLHKDLPFLPGKKVRKNQKTCF